MKDTATNLPEEMPAQPSLGTGDGLQALLSGTVFGALGAVAGNLLGAKGGEHGPRMFGKKVMTWLGGVTTGLVAVYVSLKSTAQARAEAAQPDEERVIIRKPLMETRSALVPHTQVQAAEAALHGQAADAPEKMNAR